MHFLVTGGAGFIGSHLVDLLLDRGNQVTVIDDLSTGRIGNLPTHSRLKFIQSKISDYQGSEFPETIDGLAHLAATPSVIQSWSTPLAAHRNNLSVSLEVIQFCQALKIPRLVFASSAAVYGNPDRLPLTEDCEAKPISPYGLQKLASEQYAQLFARELGFSFLGLRLFNVYGPRQQPNSPYSGVISIFANAMQQGLPIRVYGDGSQTRDFVYVEDVADAFARALTAEVLPGEAYICNIGTGSPVSILQLLEQLRSQFPAWNADIEFAPFRQGEILHSQADVSKASAVLGFTAQQSVSSGIHSLAMSLR